MIELNRDGKYITEIEINEVNINIYQTNKYCLFTEYKILLIRTKGILE